MIRKCLPTDIPMLRLVAMETFGDTFGVHTSKEDLEAYYNEAYTVEKLTSELSDPTSEVYIFEKDGEIAGYLKINWKESQTEPMGDNAFEVQRIYVRKIYKKQGIGKQLMDLAMKRAHELHVDSVWLGVWENNVAAQRFYFNYGFEHVGEHKFVAGEQVDIDWIFEKKLTNNS